MRSDARIYVLVNCKTTKIHAVDASLKHLLEELSAAYKKPNVPARMDILATLRTGANVAVKVGKTELEIRVADLGMFTK